MTLESRPGISLEVYGDVPEINLYFETQKSCQLQFCPTCEKGITPVGSL